MINNLLLLSTMANASPALYARQEANQLVCSENSRIPDSAAKCDGLLLKLKNNPNKPLTTPRSIEHGECWVSWSRDHEGTWGQLIDPVTTIISGCINGQMSAETRGAGVVKNVLKTKDGKMLNVCLMNTGEGCTDDGIVHVLPAPSPPPEPSTPPEAPASAPAPDNKRWCDKNNAFALGKKGICDGLVAKLEANKDNKIVEPREVSEGECFVSWSKPFEGTWADLIEPAKSLVSGCVDCDHCWEADASWTWRAGQMRDLQFQGNTVNVCIGKSGQGCGDNGILPVA